MSKRMEMYELIKHLKPYHLTVKDLKTLNVGDTLDVAIFDRNMEDGKIWDLKPKKLYDVVDFFSETRHTVTLSEISWHILFNYGDKHESIEHYLHIDMTDLPQSHLLKHDCENCVWHPVDREGRIGDVYWRDLPDSTRVGWRGEAMLWKDLQESKYKVYYLDPNRRSCTLL